MTILLGILTYATLDPDEESSDNQDALIKFKSQTKVAILGLFANLVGSE